MVTMDNNDYILKCARDVHRRAIMRERRDSILKDYRSFYEAYPKIFDGCLEKSFDFKMLEFMLEQRKNITSNKDNVNDIDTNVIGKLKDIYVTPLLQKMNIPIDQAPDEQIVKNFERSLAEAMANIPISK
jgi:hypothetical protein